MRRKVQEQCYRCTSPAVGRDHVPPQAFFPKPKEALGLRRDLITVPSCEAHNVGRSGDDEYAFALLASAVSPGRISAGFDRRVMKTLTRGQRPLGARMLRRSMRLWMPEGPTAGIQFERDRLEGVLRATALGLLFNEYGERVPGDLHVAVEAGPFAQSHDGGVRLYVAGPDLAHLRQGLEKLGVPAQGANPSVFTFSLARLPVPVVRMTFYDEIVVWVIGDPREWPTPETPVL